jgi:flavin-binding protein dodecin
MPQSVYKVIELIGHEPKVEAAKAAVERAAANLRICAWPRWSSRTW